VDFAQRLPSEYVEKLPSFIGGSGQIDGRTVELSTSCPIIMSSSTSSLDVPDGAAQTIHMSSRLPALSPPL